MRTSENFYRIGWGESNSPSSYSDFNSYIGTGNRDYNSRYTDYDEQDEVDISTHHHRQPPDYYGDGYDDGYRGGNTRDNTNFRRRINQTEHDQGYLYSDNNYRYRGGYPGGDFNHTHAYKHRENDPDFRKNYEHKEHSPEPYYEDRNEGWESGSNSRRYRPFNESRDHEDEYWRRNEDRFYRR